MNQCLCKDDKGNRCRNMASGLHCLRDDCARHRRGTSATEPAGESQRSNSADVGGVRRVEGSVEVVLPWDVLSSVNERQNPQSGFTLTRKYRASRQKQHELARTQYTGPMLTGPVAIRFDFYPPSKRPDMGNYVKAVKDSLQGVAYEDDGQIRDERLRWMYIDKAEPRVQVSVQAIESSEEAA